MNNQIEQFRIGMEQAQSNYEALKKSFDENYLGRQPDFDHIEDPVYAFRYLTKLQELVDAEYDSIEAREYYLLTLKEEGEISEEDMAKAQEELMESYSRFYEKMDFIKDNAAKLKRFMSEGMTNKSL